jgi:predicted AAA+ superfamily ATPase
VQRVLQDISDIRQLDQVPALMTRLAVRTASLLNIRDVSNSSKLSTISITRYLALLENLFMIAMPRP